MRVLHTSFECYPLAKVGGLADVVGSLPRYLNQEGCKTDVIVPYFDRKNITDRAAKSVYEGILAIGNDHFDYAIKELSEEELGFTIYLIDVEELIYRPNVYGYPDDPERCLAFQIAILDWLSDWHYKPDIIHCHDHHTGLLPFMAKYCFKYESLKEIPTILTIHNAQYQGQFSFEKLDDIPEFDPIHTGVLDWDDQINPLAAAIKTAWRVTSVSPNYMKELQYHANGLEGLLSHEYQKCLGIVNGIDDVHWNPETDPMMIKNYTSKTMLKGRKENKAWLCKEYDLDIKLPMFAFIGRLVYEKAADILPDVVEAVLEEGLKLSILILGSGDPVVEQRLKDLQGKYPKQYNTFIGYKEELSHIIYGGADFLLMPSRVEPCGLNQLYSLRYGTIPIVRRTGGLSDTVIDMGDEGGFGICHNQASVFDIQYSIKRGIELYADQKKYKELQKKIIKIDNSWNHSAKQYLALYESIKKTLK